MEKNSGLAIWCLLYSGLNGIDTDDLPFEVEEGERINDLLEDEDFLSTLGIDLDILDEMEEHVESLIDDEEIFSPIQFYDEYAELLLEENYKEKAKAILTVVYQKYPEESSNIKEIIRGWSIYKLI